MEIYWPEKLIASEQSSDTTLDSRRKLIVNYVSIIKL